LPVAPGTSLTSWPDAREKSDAIFCAVLLKFAATATITVSAYAPTLQVQHTAVSAMRSQLEFHFITMDGG
jgi:hypothetical protein